MGRILTHTIARLLAASALSLSLGTSQVAGQSVYTNALQGYPAGNTTYIPPQMPAYAGTPAGMQPSATQQQQQLLTAPQQVPGQTQATFGAAGGGTAIATSGALAVDPPGGLDGYNAPGAAPAGGIRAEMLARAARGLGLREGYEAEVDRLNRATEGLQAQFDQRYDFRPLLVDGTVIPPVVIEAREVGQLENDRVLRLSLGTYRIVQQARLALKAPDWRDYLFIAAKTGRARPPEFLPRNDAERRAFDQMVDQGREDGAKEAREVYKLNLARLVRDYEGMKLYQQLASQGAVSLPRVSRSAQALAISEGGSRARVGNVTLEIQVAPAFRNAPASAYLSGRPVPARPERSSAPPPPPPPAQPIPPVAAAAIAPPSSPPPQLPAAPALPKKTAASGAEVSEPMDISPALASSEKPTAPAAASPARAKPQIQPKPAKAAAPASAPAQAKSTAPTAPPVSPVNAAEEPKVAPPAAPVKPVSRPAPKFASAPKGEDLPAGRTTEKRNYEMAKIAAGVAAMPKVQSFGPPPSAAPAGVNVLDATPVDRPMSASIEAAFSTVGGL